MKRILFVLLLSMTASAQEWKPRQFFALGAGASSIASPEPSGWGVYALELRPGFYSYSQATLVASKPTTVETGIATRIVQSQGVTVLALGTAGSGFGEDNIGLSFSGGGVVHVKLYKSVGLLVGIRATDSTITTARPVIQVGICWGPPTN
jgi:hypothetical protein